jgi:BioD-like phosphotransacetylase family protein
VSVERGCERSGDGLILTIVTHSLVPSVELLDDLAVDIPLAYTFTANVIVAAGLSQLDVEELADKIEELGEAMIKPKDKLLRAVAKVQAEKEGPDEA